MAHLISDLPAVAVASIVSVMNEKLATAVEDARARGSAVRLAVRVDPDTVPALIPWLANQSQAVFPAGDRFYWHDRSRRFEIAALGQAETIRQIDGSTTDAMEKVRRRLTTLPDNMRFFGGARFAESNHPNESEWRAIPTARFVLPRFELVRYHETVLFACNLLESEVTEETSQQVRTQLAAVTFDGGELDTRPPRVLDRTDTPDRDAWDGMLQQADELLQVDDLQKVVLARRSELTFAESVAGWSMLAQLEKVSDGCFLFATEFDDGSLFLGATPERLYHRDGKRLQTEAIAGTRARAMTADDDASRIAELKASAKDSLEHQLVVDGILQALDSLGIGYKHNPEITVLTLSHVHHLACRILGKLDETVADTELLGALHPTPAVGGLPQSLALKTIRELEPFDRGWYAGPIGWLANDAAEFAVAIRSALARQDSLYLYAGAGIVPGSHPDSEWVEIESKIARYASLLAE